MSALHSPDERLALAESGRRPQRPSPLGAARPEIRGKFIWTGDEKFFVKGVTYGAFKPDADGREYQDIALLDRDFAQMAANGINTVRIPHAMPPRHLLDVALRHGLRVMVGLSAEQYAGYLIDRKKSPDIYGAIRAKVRYCSGHPALLCYAIGNEIPAATARWLGPRRVERYLRRIYQVIKAEDPGGLVTYVNYPSTEYLDLSFLDLVAFNVYLESKERLEKYLARLQNIAGNRPLLMSEIGLDSIRNGEIAQARTLDWQIRTVFQAGCAGGFIFSWTDEWHRGGAEVDDWEFGLTRRDRAPKPALRAVRQAFAESPVVPGAEWPRVSVVVCSYNGGRTIRDCLEGLTRVEYPDFEVIVVDDGSKDDTAEIAREYPATLIQTENQGLSHARNLGWQAATGEIVAYIDDDASPDPDWLSYMVDAFRRTDYVGIGGPNIPPRGDGPVADCVANAPGGPVHVLLSDEEAEHIPGCNMAFRREALEAIGGFDPQFRAAGDDVDICWRLQARGWKLGFCPAAQVWHHSRNSVRAFWRQQKGYGRAEAMLEGKWPEKYNSAGHLTWAGRVYSDAVTRIVGVRSRIYFGQWGTAPFQSLFRGDPGLLQALCLAPEWYLVNAALLALCSLGPLWAPLFWTAPLLAVSVGAPLVNIAATVAPKRLPLSLKFLTGLLHVTQPLARLYGRIAGGLTPWREREPQAFLWPIVRNFAVWTPHWRPFEARLHEIVSALGSQRKPIQCGGDYDRWDLELRGGLLGAARMRLVAEDGAEGSQYVRFRLWPRPAAIAVALAIALAALSAAAGIDGEVVAAAILGFCAVALIAGAVKQCGGAAATILDAIRPQLSNSRDRGPEDPLSAEAEVGVQDGVQQ